jgi:FlaA1/EpsC-like NDP-sugar epimerase
LYFFQQELFFSRLINGYAFVFGGTWLVFSSLMYDLILRWDKRTNKQAVYRTVIVGANRVSEKLMEKFQQDPFAPYQIIGVIDPYGLAPKNFRGKVLGKLNKLESVCEQEQVTALIQCDAFEHTINLISLAKEKNIKFLFDPALRGVLEEGLRIRRNAGQTMIQFVDRDFSGKKKLWYRFVDWVLVNIFDTD